MNQPLRVLQIVPSISLVYGGPSQMVLGFSRALAEAGADVTVLTTDSNGDAGQPPLDVPLNSPVEQEGFTVRYFRCAPFRRYKFSVGLLRWLSQHASDFDVAHIHALFSPVSSAAAMVARSHHLPYVLRPLGTLDPADLQKKRQLKQIYGTLIERPNLARAAAVHFTSSQEATVSERFGAVTQDVVVPLGVEAPAKIQHPETLLAPLGIPASPALAAPAPSIPDSTPASIPLVLFMSRLDPKKGLDLLIPALEFLHDEGIPFQFVLAGANPQDPAYENRVRDRLQSSSLAPQTVIPGFVSGDIKAALLQHADLFVLPSYYENFGIAVAEAMAAGVPVLISDQVHIWEAVKQAEAGWVSPCDTHDLAETLRQALIDRAERSRRGQQAQRLAQEHYSWRAIAHQMLEIYQRICSPL